MSKELESLLSEAKKVTVTGEHREAQRLSFAYGNTHFENQQITKATVQEAAEALCTGDEKDKTR